MKTKRALIISSAIMALILVVTVVSVSAAWFGEIKHAETRKLQITSERPSGEAEIDLTSASKYNEEIADLVPAVATNDYLLQNHDPLTGKDLRTLHTGIESAATVPKIYFPFLYSGSGDSGRSDGKKTVKIWVENAYIKLGETTTVVDGKSTTVPILDVVNYIDEFYITFRVVTQVMDEYDEINPIAATNVSATVSGNTLVFKNDDVTDITSLNHPDSIYFISVPDDKAIYMLVPPGSEAYSIELSISYNAVDEELNPATIGKTIVFGVRIAALDSRNIFNSDSVIAAVNAEND